MTILFDVGHPAHVHLFKNLIFHFKKKGYKVIVTSRQKDVTTYLLDHYKIRHIVLSKAKSGILGGLYEFLERTIKIIQLHKKHHFDVAIGTSVSIGYLSLFFAVKSYVFTDNDDLFSPQFVFLAYPFATKIVNPDCIKPIFFKNKRILYPSYQKLAYLHPDNFEPNRKVLGKYKLKPYQYVIVRLSALKAYHDKNAISLSSYIEQIKKTNKGLAFIISQENSDLHVFDPIDFHDLLYFCKLLITDSHSLSTEAACLARPAVLYSNFKNKISNSLELEKKFKMIKIFQKGKEKEMFKQITKLINSNVPQLNNKWGTKQVFLLKQKEDFNRWMINFFNKQFKKI